jgi:hypothetical protein
MNPSKRKLSRPGLPGLGQIALIMASCPQSRRLLGECFVADTKQCKKKSTEQVWVESWSGARLFRVPPDCSTTELEQRIMPYIRHFLQPDQAICVNRSAKRFTFCLVEQRQFVEGFFQGWNCAYRDHYRIELSGTDLHLTSLPTEIRQLRTLTHLNCSTNRLTSLPTEIGQLRALTHLNCSTNHLTSLPTEIGQLGALVWFQVCDNRLTRLPIEIGQLGALVWFQVCDNLLTRLPTEIGQLRALKRLRFSTNKLTSLPTEIGQLQALVRLIGDHNKMISLPTEIGQLNALVDLDVSDNELISLPSEIGQLENLIWLFHGGNQICLQRSGKSKS